MHTQNTSAGTVHQAHDGTTIQKQQTIVLTLTDSSLFVSEVECRTFPAVGVIAEVELHLRGGGRQH